jgi:hypothetical protein
MQHPPPEAEPRGLGSRLLLVLVLIVGAGLGIVYCAYQDWLLGVILAALVPGSAVAWVLEPVQGLRAQGPETSR